jgi:DNA-directed RNA polymerase specialized sigma24 family protein
MHDAMLRLIERIAQFRGDAPFWGWLRSLTKQMLAGGFRSQACSRFPLSRLRERVG